MSFFGLILLKNKQTNELLRIWLKWWKHIFSNFCPVLRQIRFSVSIKLDQTLKRHSSFTTLSLQPSGASGCRAVPSCVGRPSHAQSDFWNRFFPALPSVTLHAVVLRWPNWIRYSSDSVTVFDCECLSCSVDFLHVVVVPFLNELLPVWLSPQGNILNQFPRWCFHRVCMLHGVLLFLFPLKMPLFLPVCDSMEENGLLLVVTVCSGVLIDEAVNLRCSAEVKISLLETGSSQKLNTLFACNLLTWKSL